MAYISTSTYDFPSPSNYLSTFTPLESLTQNANGVQIGEFVKNRYTVRSFYYELTVADYRAICAAAGYTPTTRSVVAITFLDIDTGTYLTKNMILTPPTKELSIDGSMCYDVTIELTEM